MLNITSRFFGAILVVSIACLGGACAEAANPNGSGGAGGEGGQNTTSTGNGGSGMGTSSSTTTSGAGGASATIDDVVFNEIGAVGADYVEIENLGAAPVDLTDYGIADSDSNGDPKLDAVMRFPNGAFIAPGERLLIVGEQNPDDGVGPHGDCLPDGPATCYWASWAISASNGETIFLVSPDDDIVIEQEYPQDAAGDGNSWGRLPDGTGDFMETLATPGSVNVAP